jgi:hypothetical protein
MLEKVGLFLSPLFLKQAQGLWAMVVAVVVVWPEYLCTGGHRNGLGTRRQSFARSMLVLRLLPRRREKQSGISCIFSPEQE